MSRVNINKWLLICLFLLSGGVWLYGMQSRNWLYWLFGGIAYFILYFVIMRLRFDRLYRERRMELQLRIVPDLDEHYAKLAEHGRCSVILESAGEKPIKTIKILRQIYILGLKDAKDIVDNAPHVIKENVAVAEAEFVKSRLEQTGAWVSIVEQIER